MLIISVLVILIPLHLAFDVNFQEYYFIEFAIVILLFDSLIYLNTNIYKNGILITGRKIILFNYIKNRLWQDILTLFPIIYHKSMRTVTYL